MGVTGASVHTPRQRNSTYVQTVRRSIYKTRQPEHLHSPIRWYEQLPQIPSPRPRYMKSCTNTALLYATSTSTYTFRATSTASRVSAVVTIPAGTAPLRQYPTHCRIRYPTLSPSLAYAVLCWQPFLTWLDSSIFDLIRLNCFWFDSTHPFFDLIWLTYFSTWFDSPVSIWFDSIVFRFESTQLFFDLLTIFFWFD